MSIHKVDHKSILAMLGFATFIHVSLLWRSCDSPTRINLTTGDKTLRLSLPSGHSLKAKRRPRIGAKNPRLGATSALTPRPDLDSPLSDLVPPPQPLDFDVHQTTAPAIGEATSTGPINLGLGAIEGSLGDYEKVLLEHIRSHEYYPKAAQMRRLEGDVGLEFTVLSDGSLSNLLVTVSSRHEILDATAKDILLVSTPLPPPSSFGLGKRTYLLPIYFRASEN